MPELKASSNIPNSLVQNAHCILCGFSPLTIVKQIGLPDQIKCPRCNQAIEMDTSRKYFRIVHLPKALSGDFNTDWMKLSDLRKYIKELYNQKMGHFPTHARSPVGVSPDREQVPSPFLPPGMGMAGDPFSVPDLPPPLPQEIPPANLVPEDAPQALSEPNPGSPPDPLEPVSPSPQPLIEMASSSIKEAPQPVLEALPALELPVSDPPDQNKLDESFLPESPIGEPDAPAEVEELPSESIPAERQPLAPFEPVEPEPVSEVEQTDRNEMPTGWLENSRPMPDQYIQWICPYLKLENDSSLCFAYPHPDNACYKMKPQQVVSLDHQGDVCLSGRSSFCPVLSEEFDGVFPPGLKGKHQPAFNLRSLWFRFTAVLAIVLVLAGGAYSLYKTGILTSLVSPLPTPDLRGQSWLVPTLSPSFNFVSSRTSTQPAPTFTPAPTSTFTLEPSLTATQAITLFTTQSIIFAHDITLGPQNQYVIHVVSAGENIDLLSQAYHMTPAAIKKVNPALSISTPQPDMTLVLVPGRNDPSGLIPLQAVQNKRLTRLLSFLSVYSISEATYRTYNLYTGEQLLIGQWLIVPINPATPTPNPTPKP